MTIVDTVRTVKGIIYVRVIYSSMCGYVCVYMCVVVSMIGDISEYAALSKFKYLHTMLIILYGRLAVVSFFT